MNFLDFRTCCVLESSVELGEERTELSKNVVLYLSLYNLMVLRYLMRVLSEPRKSEISLKCSCVVCYPISLAMRFRSLSKSYSELREIKGWNFASVGVVPITG